MKKRGLLLGILLVLALAVLAGCAAPSPAAPTQAPTQAPTDAPTQAPTDAPTQAPEAAGERTFTLEELAAFDGKNGQPAYIAVDGVVYDVTNSALWGGGAHNGFSAGKDLTSEIKSASPHGVSVLERIPVVGKIE